MRSATYDPEPRYPAPAGWTTQLSSVPHSMA